LGVIFDQNSKNSKEDDFFKTLMEFSLNSSHLEQNLKVQKDSSQYSLQDKKELECSSSESFDKIQLEHLHANSHLTFTQDFLKIFKYARYFRRAIFK